MTAIPTFPEFSGLSLRHKETVEAYTRIFPPYSDYTFPSLWSWNIHEQIELSDLNGNLVVRFTDYVTNEKFLSFLGNKEVIKTLETLFALIERAPDHLSYLKLIPEHNLHGIHLSNGFEAVEDLDNHDYVYSLQKLSAYPGKKYETIRYQLNRFFRKYTPQFVELNLSCKTTCRDMEVLCGIWKERKTKKGNDVTNDIDALRRLINAACTINLSALGVYVNGNLAGYAVSELNDRSYATNLFEHADVDYAGVFVSLRNQVAQRLQATGYQYLNHQQDLGIEELRESKRRYRPSFFLKKFIIRRTREIAL